ncbi:hypothetical protein DFJ58DRAFT_746755 [Suillus subalutaceus]|uniref:uncharacterized protein n=1 Tax=Suillus subalutaceus TaxID=48586 RepID=UPI001B862C67|nr:uncharacterized protein DFJ58DRAFT_746755 [Suillus subalutaceus]KAG1848719.1 hypothetical protein DFJ58DRAFT_746755 [Suillus subalutaceus]
MMTLSCPKVTSDNTALNSKAQTEIDDELEALEERKRALRTRRNSHSPISSIPPELLSTIFVFHVQQTQSRYSPDNPDALLWLIIGRICRHWREIALGTPELWATPFLNSSKATDEMLTRIQNGSVELENWPAISYGLHPNGVDAHGAFGSGLSSLSSCSAPKLRSLALEVGNRQTPRIAIPIYFPAPNLCDLRIKHCDLSWASSVLTGLTVLDIKKISPECLPTLDELISALRRMPALHTLVLEDALPTLSPHTASLPRAPHAMNVQLFHLKHLRLTATMLEVANVLTCIESTTSEVQLISLDKPLVPCKCLPLVVAFALRYSTVRNPSSWATTTSCLDLSAEYPIILDFDFPIDMTRTILSDLGRIVPLGSIEAMYFGCFFACWDGFWADVLTRGGARNLAYMHLRGPFEVLEELLKSLRSRKHSVSRSVGGRSQQGPIFSPALSHLVLHRLEFDSSIFNWMRPSDLLDVLIDRVNEGRGLDHLAITLTSGIFARDVQLLREVVADVSWDGYASDEEYLTDYMEEDDDDDDDDFMDYEFYSDGYAS